MSIVVCERCDRYIDSDLDMYCFVEPPAGMCTPAQHQALTETICEPCRERAWDDAQVKAMEG